MQTDLPEPEPLLDHNEAWAETRPAKGHDVQLRKSGARLVERRRGQEPVWEWMGQRYRESELAKMLLEPASNASNRR